MDEPTVPLGEPELWSVSEYRRAVHDLVMRDPDHPSRFASLSPSLMADLERFEQGDGGVEVLEVMAACLRHSQNVALHLDREGKVLPLTVFPRERLFHTPLPLDMLLASHFDRMRLLDVEPAVLEPPLERPGALTADTAQCHPLAPLLWALALDGARRELLPEIAGTAAYRIVPDHEVPDTLPEALLAAVDRLRTSAATLKTIAHWPGLDRERACRLLNGLYLQSGLIVSRTHPAALGGDSWFAGLGPR